MGSPIALSVGKLRVQKALYPTEPGFVASIKSQMKTITNEITSIFSQLENATPQILLDAIQPTYEKSKVYCPKRTGRLVNSAYLEITSFRGSPRVECGYARGGDPPYAVAVHELVEQYHRPPTRSKWHQAAMLEDLDQIRGRLITSYSAMFGGAK